MMVKVETTDYDSFAVLNLADGKTCTAQKRHDSVSHFTLLVGLVDERRGYVRISGLTSAVSGWKA
jgi:hypothetical protein